MARGQERPILWSTTFYRVEWINDEHSRIAHLYGAEPICVQHLSWTGVGQPRARLCLSQPTSSIAKHMKPAQHNNTRLMERPAAERHKHIYLCVISFRSHGIRSPYARSAYCLYSNINVIYRTYFMAGTISL